MGDARNSIVPAIVISSHADEETNEPTSKDPDSDIYMKYILALQDAQLWKKRYYTSTNQKVHQLTNIESNLMILEARLQAERIEIERRFNKQAKAMKEQKRKIERLTTANQKLLSGLMTLSKQQNQLPDEATEIKPPPNNKNNLKQENTTITINKTPTNQQEPNASDHKEKRTKQLNSNFCKSGTRTHRSKSLPLNNQLRFLKTSTAC